MSRAVLDASALLALLNQENGGEEVADLVAAGAAISAVNLSEVAAKLSLAGMPDSLVREALDTLGLEVVPFDSVAAYRTALLVGPTRGAGLSLGDRACLALADQLSLPAVTSDRAWRDLGLAVQLRLIR
ncbi:MAG TPA: type II toxin-antitoxin system VapC family toxin [Chloroflexota bacterium]|nr:type II toxin-antitoxin system VapC family toxin [Chloroflexota bacterium]